MISEGERSHVAWIAAPALGALALALCMEVPGRVEASLLFFIALFLTFLVWRKVCRKRSVLYTVTNVLDALRDGDYGVRAVQVAGKGELIDVLKSVNALASKLQDAQRDSQQGLQLLRKTLAALECAVFVFDGNDILRLVNPAGERLMSCQTGQLLGTDATTLGLAALLECKAGTTQQLQLSTGAGRWQIDPKVLWSGSSAGRLLVLQPVERVLRQEEAQAFNRLLRVLGHEINNSMSPIASMAETLQQLLGSQQARGDELDPDVLRGLQVIECRSRALQRFVGRYAQLAKLPSPVPRPTDLATLCKGVVSLLEKEMVMLLGGEDACVWVDSDQLEQVLINLLKNALEAAGTGEVSISWKVERSWAVVDIIDNGPGLPSSGNIFVPFFTTKPNGAGIGLVLARAIVEANGGELTLSQRSEASGTVARLRLPLSESGQSLTAAYT